MSQPRPITHSDLIDMRRQINEDLDAAFRKLQTLTKNYVDAETRKLRAEIAGLAEQQKTQAKDAAEETHTLTVISPDMQAQINGMITKQTVATANKVLKVVSDKINKDVMPQIQKTMDWVNYSTQDGTQLVTDYRSHMVETMYTDKSRAIEGKSTSGQFSTCNGAVSLFFNDDE